MKILMDGRIMAAHLDRHYADTTIGHAALVLESGSIIEPSFAVIRSIKLIEATPDERRALEAAGYALPDANPTDKDAVS
jgi:hypothetical protein